MKLRSIYVLLKLPFDLLLVIVRFYIFGGIKFRKFNRSLINCLKLTIFRAGLSVDIMDSRWLGPWTNHMLINKIIPLMTGLLVKGLPGYGQQYDPNSIWLVKQPDRKPSDPVIIYLHGGGYFLQTMPEQVRSVLSMYHLLDAEKQKKTSLLLLDYKLVSHGYSFPTQLKQMHEVYSKLVADGNTNIILMGDSAGGHLSVSYTQYLKQLSGPVTYPKQLLLISPWVKLSPLPADYVEGNSWVDNEHYDTITRAKFANKTDLIRIIGGEDPFSIIHSPGGKVPRLREDWSDIPTYLDPKYSVFMILGEDESFRDDILEWGKYALGVPWHEKVKYGNLHKFLEKQHYELERRNEPGQANLSVFVEPQGVHDSMLFFESTAVGPIQRALKKGERPSAKELDDVQYFGLKRLVLFLNETL